MREEIAAAVVFIKRLIKKNESLTEEQAQTFCDNLSALLVEKFRNHWYEEDPMKGQGYRCIRINDARPIDSVLEKAAGCSGLRYWELSLPPELTMWVDPKEVCCRFGELKGYCFTVASFKNGSNDNKASTLDIDDLLETQKQQRLDDLTRLQHHTSRRSQRGPKNNGSNVGTKYRKNVQNPGKQNQYKWTRSMTPTTTSSTATPVTSHHHQSSPKNHQQHHYQATQMQYFSNPMKHDQFRWVRGQDLVKA